MPSELRRPQVWYLTLALLVLVGFLSFYRLDEAVHIDSVLWFKLTQGFWGALARGKLAATARAPHPGVTLMWVSGLMMKLQGTLGGNIDPRGVVAIKLPGALIGTLASAFTFPLAIACLGKSEWRVALVLAALLGTEPPLIENSRMGELDMAALGFAWLGLWVAILAYERNSWRIALGAGALFGATVLTKLSFGAIPAALMLILTGTTVARRFRDVRGLKVAVFASLGAVVTVFVLWPALWVQPVTTLTRLLRDNVALAEHGHSKIIDGKRTLNPGVGYYAWYVLQVSAAETMILAGFGAFALYSLPRLRRHYVWLIVSMVPYLVMIALAPKKHSRYALPMMSVLCLLTSAAIEWLRPRISTLWSRTRLTPVGLMSLLPLLFAARYVRELQLLPEAEHCTGWPGIVCGGRPGDKNFGRPIALAIKPDWEGSGRRMPARVYGVVPECLEPWLRVKRSRSVEDSDYVVIWDGSYQDPEGDKLAPAAAEKFAGLGKELTTLRYADQVALRIYRQRRR